jgi:hypothetical protein
MSRQPEIQDPAALTVDADGTRRAALLEAIGVLTGGTEERFERITRIAREAFGVQGSYLNLVDDSTLHVKSGSSLVSVPSAFAIADTFCGRSIGQDGPVVVPDASADARFADLPSVTGDPGVRFYAGAPLSVGDDAGGTKIGTLCLVDPSPRVLDDDDLQLLTDLARWAERELAAGIDRDRLRAVLASMEPADVDLAGYAIAGCSIPYGTVAGDYHDWQVTPDGLHLTVADVMGKGMAAGLLASGIRSALIARTGLGPDAAVAGLETQVAPELSRAEAFATLFHARLSPRNGRVDFVDAGHGLVLHLRADGSENVLRSLDLPIGLHPTGIPRASGSVVLQRGDALLVVTDGVLELFDSTIAGLLELGAVYRAAGDVETFMDRVRDLVADRAPVDDTTVVVVARNA